MPSTGTVRVAKEAPLPDRVCIDAAHRSQLGIDTVDPESHGILSGKWKDIIFNFQY